MDFEFVRHEPVYDRMIFVLTLDRQKMKERILVGEEQEIRFRLQGDGEADVLCDVTRPLGSLLAEFEHDPDREWNLNGLSPLREALHTNRWSQPALEQKAGDFLAKISHRRSGENVCGVPYLERIFAGKAPTGKGGSL